MTTDAAAPAERQRVLEVRELGLQAPQQPRQRPGHPQLLRAAPGSSIGSTPVGHELGVPRDRGEAAGRARRPGSSRSRFEHVGLVAGALPAEHVGVEHDHASSS